MRISAFGVERSKPAGAVTNIDGPSCVSGGATLVAAPSPTLGSPASIGSLEIGAENQCAGWALQRAQLSADSPSTRMWPHSRQLHAISFAIFSRSGAGTMSTATWLRRASDSEML